MVFVKNFGKSKLCLVEEKTPIIIEVSKRKGSIEGSQKSPLRKEKRETIGGE